MLETGSKRKVDRAYPFHDAVQWLVDHSDLVLLVYDYSKLDVGPEAEALLDQLKGRESQVRTSRMARSKELAATTTTAVVLLLSSSSSSLLLLLLLLLCSCCSSCCTSAVAALHEKYKKIKQQQQYLC